MTSQEMINFARMGMGVYFVSIVSRIYGPFADTMRSFDALAIGKVIA